MINLRKERLIIQLTETTEEELYEFCAGNYYYDIEEKIVCSTYENYPVSEIEEMIQVEICALKTFLKIGGDI